QDKASEIVKKMTKGQLQVEAQKALINGFAKDEKSWEIFRQEVEKAIKREKGRTRTATTRSDKGR
ncbi:MAG: hypothetical protein MJ078_05835, partial [Clostridia bacterium]|nr:hypothetical protein [Clostridia bacterium]